MFFLWAEGTKIVQSVKNPELTNMQLLQQLPHSIICDWRTKSERMAKNKLEQTTYRDTEEVFKQIEEEYSAPTLSFNSKLQLIIRRGLKAKK